MRVAARTLVFFAALSSVTAANLVLSNDDGWAEVNVRTFFNTLIAAGQKVVLSAPAQNESGTSSLDAPPTTVGSDGCEFSSCPAGSPATGADPNDPRLNYVNSYPVTAMKYGVNTLAPKLLGAKVELVVTGPNVGSNLGLSVPFSGTVGAASAASDQLSIPGLAFSGSTGTQESYTTTPTPPSAQLYADWSLNITSTILASGTPYLPAATWLNVNFPAIGAGCETVGGVKFVLSRIYTAVPLISGTDVVTCGNGGRLPTETKVVGTAGCYASVSVGKASDKRDANAMAQGVVLGKLGKTLVCLPS